MSVGRPNLTSEKIIKLLKKKGDMPQTTMVDELGLPKTTINYAVLQLLANGTIEVKKKIGKRMKIIGLK